MKKTSPALFFLLLLISFACKTTETENPSISVNNQNLEVKIESNSALKEYTWPNGEFKLKLPCDISKKTLADTAEQLNPGEVNKVYHCDANKFRFSVSSKKSVQNLREEFEKIKAEKKVKERKVNGVTAIDYIDSTRTISTTSTRGFPDYKEIETKIIKNRFYLVNNRWLLGFAVSCSAKQENYCEDVMLNSADGTVAEFFDSLELIN